MAGEGGCAEDLDLLPIFVGLLAIGPVGGVLELDGFGRTEGSFQERLNGSLADLFFLSVCPALGINLIFNRDYGARYRHDNMSRRLAFVRGLPISAGEIVTGRSLTMLLAFAIAVPCFFLPLFLVSPGVDGRTGTAEFCSFAAIWVGYALFAAGFYGYAWLGFSGREDIKGAFGLLVGFLLTAVACNFVLDVHLVSCSMGLAREHGPFVAVPALAAGATGFVLWGFATRSRLQKRDLSV